MTTRRVQTCPVDNWPLDDHTDEQLVDCDKIAINYYEIAQQLNNIQLPKQPKIHDSWFWRLPERYQG
jgi:hypothetical protein